MIRNMKFLFSDKIEFQVLDKYPALQLQKRRLHGLPKIHKKFEAFPPLWLIVGTTNTPYHSISKFLANLLNLLTLKNFAVKDSFDGANNIKQIPKESFDSGYKFFSFYVILLFTNVPLIKGINIILKYVYSE